MSDSKPSQPSNSELPVAKDADNDATAVPEPKLPSNKDEQPPKSDNDDGKVASASGERPIGMKNRRIIQAKVQKRARRMLLRQVYMQYTNPFFTRDDQSTSVINLVDDESSGEEVASTSATGVSRLSTTSMSTLQAASSTTIDDPSTSVINLADDESSGEGVASGSATGRSLLHTSNSILQAANNNTPTGDVIINVSDDDDSSVEIVNSTSPD